MAVGWAVREDLAGRTEKWLANELAVDPSTLSRWLNGQVDITLNDLIRIEQALGVGRGRLLRRAGLVDELDCVRDAIETDRDLSRGHRRILLRIYDSLVEETSEERRS